MPTIWGHMESLCKLSDAFSFSSFSVDSVEIRSRVGVAQEHFLPTHWWLHSKTCFVWPCRWFDDSTASHNVLLLMVWVLKTLVELNSYISSQGYGTLSCVVTIWSADYTWPNTCALWTRDYNTWPSVSRFWFGAYLWCASCCSCLCVSLNERLFSLCEHLLVAGVCRDIRQVFWECVWVGSHLPYRQGAQCSSRSVALMWLCLME